MRGLVIEVEGSLTADEVESVWTLIDAGEPGIALEIICDQLYEPDTAVGCDTVERLRLVGLRMELDPALWENLRTTA